VPSAPGTASEVSQMFRKCLMKQKIQDMTQWLSYSMFIHPTLTDWTFKVIYTETYPKKLMLSPLISRIPQRNRAHWERNLFWESKPHNYRIWQIQNLQGRLSGWRTESELMLQLKARVSLLAQGEICLLIQSFPQLTGWDPPALWRAIFFIQNQQI
jgi:hypothetical protein